MKTMEPPYQEKTKPVAERIINTDTPDFISSRITMQAKRNSNLFGDAIQRDELDDEIQKKDANEGISTEGAVSSGGNTGIPANVQAKMEGAFNRSFSEVKVHSNSSKAVEAGALAFTQGKNVHFAPGQYNPSSSSGQKLLGHELTHVVQQSEGKVAATSSVAGMPLNDSPVLEREADVKGEQASRY